MPGLEETPLESETNGHSSPKSTVSLDMNKFLEYLSELLYITLGASDQDLKSTDSLLCPNEKFNTTQLCQKFLTTSQTALYVQKLVAPGKTEHGVVPWSVWNLILNRICGRPTCIYFHLHRRTTSPAGQDFNCDSSLAQTTLTSKFGKAFQRSTSGCQPAWLQCERYALQWSDKRTLPLQSAARRTSLRDQLLPRRVGEIQGFDGGIGSWS